VSFAALALAASVASVIGEAPGSPDPKQVALGESFELRPGETGVIEAEALQIGFDEVAGDSRCPKNVQCIWEGDATVRVWLRQAAGPKQVLELHTPAKDRGSASFLAYSVRLVRLDPYPVLGKTITRRDYLATLEVTRGSSPGSDTR